MFDFFDGSMNPFMAMLNSEKTEEDGKNPQGGFGFPFPGADANGEMNPMQWMQQAWMMQMQLAQCMFMMPFQMMQGIAGFMGAFGDSGNDAEDKAPAHAGGFQVGSVQIPPEMLQFLLKLEMSPENLKKLQKVLDFSFSLLPESKDKE